MLKRPADMGNWLKPVKQGTRGNHFYAEPHLALCVAPWNRLGSQRFPGFLVEDFNQFVAAFAHAGAEDG